MIWFVPLGLRHLVPSDEGRYAEMAREMFVTGDWITPRYNGYKYFEKPPLQTWANALTFAWFGIGEWQARLYTALTGFAGVLLIGYTGARVFNGVTGFCAAVILATRAVLEPDGPLQYARHGPVVLDGTDAVRAAARAAPEPAVSRSAPVDVGLLGRDGAALLSKGLVGIILPGAVLVLYTLITRDWALWKRLYLDRAG